MRDSEDVSEVASDFHLDQTEFNLDQQIFSPCFSVILPFKVNTSIIKKKKKKLRFKLFTVLVFLKISSYLRTLRMSFIRTMLY